MSFPEFTTTAAIKELFTEEIEAAGGLVTNTFEAESYFMARATLPEVRQVGPGDGVKGGVALLADQEKIQVHPYVFRQVCSNGAIMTQVVQSHQIVHSELESSYETCSNVRQAIRECCLPEVFAGNARRIQEARHGTTNLLIQLMPELSRMNRQNALQLFQAIMTRFMNAGDASQFGLMNAVTSVARDTPDPKLRWRLEELGGGIAIGKFPQHPTHGGAALAIPDEEEPSRQSTTSDIALSVR